MDYSVALFLFCSHFVLYSLRFSCCTLYMSHLFSCCTVFMLCFFTLISCFTFFVLHSFCVALFPCYTFLKTFRVALSSCCTLFLLNFFQHALFMYCTLLIMHLFVYWTLLLLHLFSCRFTLHSFLVALFPCCAFYMLSSFHDAPFFEFHFFQNALYSYCTIFCPVLF